MEGVNLLNIDAKKLENSRMELQINVPVDNVEQEYKTVFNKIQSGATIDGFRKGKAPLGLVENRYQELADKEVSENLLKRAFMDAVTEKQLTPIAQPQYEFDRISRGEPFSFKAVFEVPPSITLGKYKELHADENSCIITEEDVDNEIESIRERDSKVHKKEIDPVIENGDLAKIKVKRIDDVQKDEIDKVDFKEYSIVVGKSKDESALDKHLAGMNLGEEKEIEVRYPKGYYIKELSGQKVKYLVRIEDVSTIELPELNDEFAKKVQYESMDDFRKKTREYLEKFVSERAMGDAKAQILKNIVENSDFDIPESMILTEMAVIFRKTQERVGYVSDNLTEFCKAFGMDQEEFRNKLREEAVMSIKTTLALQEIAKKEDLKPSEEKFREVLQNIAIRNSKSIEEIDKLITENNSRERIEYELLLDSAMDFIYDNAKIKKLKPVTLDEFLKKED